MALKMTQSSCALIRSNTRLYVLDKMRLRKRVKPDRGKMMVMKVHGERIGRIESTERECDDALSELLEEEDEIQEEDGAEEVVSMKLDTMPKRKRDRVNLP